MGHMTARPLQVGRAIVVQLCTSYPPTHPLIGVWGGGRAVFSVGWLGRAHMLIAVRFVLLLICV